MFLTYPKTSRAPKPLVLRAHIRPLWADGRSSNKAKLSGLIDDVERCSSALEEYWLCKPATNKEDKVLAPIVRARFSALAVFYDEATGLLLTERVREYQVLQMTLFKEGTGGNFEGNDRDVDSNRAIDAYRISREIVQVLRLGRRERLSTLHRFARLLQKG